MEIPGPVSPLTAPLPKIFANEEAEQALLGILLMDNKWYSHVAGIVKSDDFYADVHGRMFSIIEQHVLSGKKADPITMKSTFDDDPDLTHLGGADYLFDLVTNVVVAANVVGYAEVVAEMSTCRKAQNVLSQAKYDIEHNDSEEPVITLISKAIGEMEKINFRGEMSKFRADIVQEILAGIDRPRARDKTGIVRIDAGMAGGLYRGFTYGIAAKEKVGKTVLASSISYNLNMSGVRHAYLALEMGSKQIEERCLARHMSCNSLDFLKHNDTPGRKEYIAHYAAQMPNNTIYVDVPGASFDMIKTELSRLHIRYRIAGAIVDYWQLIGGRDKRQTEESHLRDVAQQLSDFGRQRGVWIILIAQLSADGIRTFAGSGIKKACDQLYYLHRHDGDRDHLAWLEMVATRYTEKADIGSKSEPSLHFHKRIGPYFSDLEEDNFDFDPI